MLPGMLNPEAEVPPPTTFYPDLLFGMYDFFL